MKKFEKEFAGCFSEVDKTAKGTLDYGALQAFMRLFGCVKTNSDEEVLLEFWKVAEGDKKAGITKASLLQLLKDILHIQSMQKRSEKNETKPDGDSVLISEKQAEMLHRKFYSFYVNRQCGACAEEASGTPSAAECTFQPQISKKSEVLATVAYSKLEGDTVEEKLYNRHKKLAELVWRG